MKKGRKGDYIGMFYFDPRFINNNLLSINLDFDPHQDKTNLFCYDQGFRYYNILNRGHDPYRLHGSKNPIGTVDFSTGLFSEYLSTGIVFKGKFLTVWPNESINILV